MNHLLTRFFRLLWKKNKIPVSFSVPACFASNRKWAHFLLFLLFVSPTKFPIKMHLIVIFFFVETESPQPSAPFCWKWENSQTWKRDIPWLGSWEGVFVCSFVSSFLCVTDADPVSHCCSLHYTCITRWWNEKERERRRETQGTHATERKTTFTENFGRKMSWEKTHWSSRWDWTV